MEARTNHELEAVGKRRRKVRETGSLEYFLTAIATDAVLLEIFVRLPNARLVWQFSTVCKRWLSVISSPDFVPKFSQHHVHTPRPLTLLFAGSAGKLVPRRTPRAFFSDESRLLHGPRRWMRSDYLSFLPGYSNSAVKAAFDDLILVLSAPTSLLVCNPLTRQRVWLPPQEETFAYNLAGYALVGDPNNSSREGRSLGYAAVLYNLRSDDDRLVFRIFRSRTGRWDRERPSFQLDHGDAPAGPAVGAGDGVVYCLVVATEGHRVVKKIAAFDAFRPSYRAIEPPAHRFGRGWRATCTWTRIGAVRGRLRLWQLYGHRRSGILVLKVWELEGGGEPRWASVHDVRARMGGHPLPNPAFPAALHPDDGNVVFFAAQPYFPDYWQRNVRNSSPDIWRYDIRRNRCDRICRFSNPTDVVWVYALSHPSSFPTTIPDVS